MKKGTISVATSSQLEFVDITGDLQQHVSQSGCPEGILYVYNPHTTAGLTINEGADPAVQTDIIKCFQEIVPFHLPFKHLEGNSPSHFMTTLTGSSLSVFIDSGRLQLGTWQRIFFLEFDGPRSRKVFWKIMEG
jgi:secondary thiamine-phosphate synthase enzyme